MRTALPFEPGAIDWTLGVECRFDQLPDVIRRADAAGFDAVRLRVLASGYEVGFQRKPEWTQPLISQLRDETGEKIAPR